VSNAVRSGNGGIASKAVTSKAVTMATTIMAFRHIAAIAVRIKFNIGAFASLGQAPKSLALFCV
jgi:hypothetical protein